MEIDLDDLEWQRVPEGLASNSHTASEARPEPLLTIAEAKKRLAVTFGVKPDAIEITIRG